MNNIISLIMGSESPVLIVFLSIALVFLLSKSFYDSGKWILDRLNGYHKIRNNVENEKEVTEKRISTLEGHDKWQYQKLTELTEEMKKLISMVQKVQDTQAQMIIDTYRRTIFKIHHETTLRGFITQTEIDQFVDLVKMYKEAGGNGIVDEKIYPEVMALPIQSKQE